MIGKLEDILNQIQELPWDHDLYVTSTDLSLGQEVGVFDDEYEPEEKSALKYYLTIQDVQSVIENIEAQVINPTQQQKLMAIKHYHANDAFMQVQD